jgi:hypothetical protein
MNAKYEYEKNKIREKLMFFTAGQCRKEKINQKRSRIQLLSGYPLVSPDNLHSPPGCLCGIKNPEKAKEVLEHKILQR